MKELRFNRYVEAICIAFNLSRINLFKKSKKTDDVDPRQMLYYICMSTGFRYTNIIRLMDKNGYATANSTIRFGMNAMTEKLKTERDYQDLVNQLNEI